MDDPIESSASLGSSRHKYCHFFFLDLGKPFLSEIRAYNLQSFNYFHSHVRRYDASSVSVLL